MNCPECDKPDIDSEEWIRGYCKECNIKKHTCDGCGQLVQDYVLYHVSQGMVLKKGHKECILPDDQNHRVKEAGDSINIAGEDIPVR